jgi:iron complex transport system substrate-binding protein
MRRKADWDAVRHPGIPARSGGGPRPGRGRRSRPAALALLPAVAGAVLAACSTSATAQGAKTVTITDMTGRKVTIPATITRVATVGSVPVLNSFPFAVGAGNEIVNGIPGGDAQGLGAAPYPSYTVLAPKLVHAPSVEDGIGGAPEDEALIALKPQVILTDSAQIASEIQPLGIPAVVINLNTGNNIKAAVTLTGKVLGKEQAAANYVKYFNSTLAQVQHLGAGVPASQRPSVLYFDTDPLRRPNLIMEWMLDQLKANSVTHSVSVNQYLFTVEQMQTWNPEVLIGMEPYDGLSTLKANPQMADLQAVKSGKVYVVPTGIQIWGNNTAEQPLMLLWLAKYLYPTRASSIDLTTVTKQFYQQIFNVSLTNSQVTQVLNNQYGTS